MSTADLLNNNLEEDKNYQIIYDYINKTLNYLKTNNLEKHNKIKNIIYSNSNYKKISNLIGSYIGDIKNSKINYIEKIKNNYIHTYNFINTIRKYNVDIDNTLINDPINFNKNSEFNLKNNFIIGLKSFNIEYISETHLAYINTEKPRLYNNCDEKNNISNYMIINYSNNKLSNDNCIINNKLIYKTTELNIQNNNENQKDISKDNMLKHNKNFERIIPCKNGSIKEHSTPIKELKLLTKYPSNHKNNQSLFDIENTTNNKSLLSHKRKRGNPNFGITNYNIKKNACNFYNLKKKILTNDICKKENNLDNLNNKFDKQANFTNMNDIYCIKGCEYNRKDCNLKMIFCEGKCKTWYHLKCMNIKDEELNEFESRGLDWYCNFCNMNLT